MKYFMTKMITEEKGQGMTEYGLILGLIAFAAVTALGLFGDEIFGMIGDLTDAISGARDEVTPDTTQ